jgi:hypothetical protein
MTTAVARWASCPLKWFTGTPDGQPAPEAKSPCGRAKPPCSPKSAPRPQRTRSQKCMYYAPTTRRRPNESDSSQNSTVTGYAQDVDVECLLHRHRRRAKGAKPMAGRWQVGVDTSLTMDNTWPVRQSKKRESSLIYRVNSKLML